MSIAISNLMSAYTQIKTFDNSTWIRVFYHNIKGNVFSSRDEAQFYISKYKYSLLSLIDESAKINNQLEFIIDYPGYEGYNQWRQDRNPLYDIETDNSSRPTAYGYTPIYISWNSSTGVNYSHFGGLVRSSVKKTLLDGHVNMDVVNDTRWFFALGVTSPYYNGIPGFKSGIGFKEVELWLKVNQVNFYYEENCYLKNIYFMICMCGILPLISFEGVNW